MSGNRQKPLIVGFVADLMFTVRIEDVVRRLGYRVVWIEHSDQIALPEKDTPLRQLAEHLVGPGAVLLDKLTSWRPALIIFDLSNPNIPWRKWVALIKSAPATRRTPVMCYGPHIGIEKMEAASKAGADVVLARSRFVHDLYDLIQKYALIPDYATLEDTCQAKLSDIALMGLKLFNQSNYYEAHEFLEDAWRQDQSLGRELYRAILQVAVAYLQIERGNYNGAVKMFLRVRQWIDPLPDRCRGVDVAQLRADANMAYEQLLSLGRERISEFNHDLLRPVYFHMEL